MAGPRITEVSLSLCACRCPTGCDPVFAAMALSLCLSRHGGPAAWLRGSSPHSAGNVSVWMCIQLSRFRRSQAPTMLLGTFWAKRFIFLITPFTFINGNFFGKNLKLFCPSLGSPREGPEINQKSKIYAHFLFFVHGCTFRQYRFPHNPLTLQLEKNRQKVGKNPSCFF